MEFIKKVEQIAYETELKEIMSLKKGTLICLECYETEFDKEYYAGQEKAYEYAMEKGYIELTKTYFDLFGKITQMNFKRI